MATRQQLEQQLVAAHRSGNVQAAQQAAYNIRAYDAAIARGGSGFDWNVPSVNAPPPIERVPKPTFGSWLENVGIGIGEGLGEQVQGIGELAQRGVSALGAYAKDPLKASAAAFMGALAPAMRGFTQPAQTARDVGAGVVETGKQMYQQATSGPVGLGTVIGQNLDLPGPSGQRRPTMAELDVYHGTPHTFEPEEGAPLGRFRSSKIGTGEGAQAYGYGLYFAESPTVAGGYKTTLSTKDKNRITLDGQRVDPDTMLGRSLEDLKKLGRQSALQKLDDNIRFNEKYAPDMAELYRSVRNKIDTIDESKVSVKEGSLYTVDLPDAKIEQMLDWDKPLSEQPENVRQALRGIFTREFESGDPTGADIYQALVQDARDIAIIKGNNKATTLSASQQKASQDLTELGIPGIKYLDAGSRDGGKGTRNFVVFPGEEQNLTILERDGVKAEVPKPDAPKPRTAPQYNFAKESQRVSNLVNAENVSLADYEPKTKKLNTTYAGPAKKDRFGYLQEFKLKRKIGDDQEINVYVGTDELMQDLPDARFDPNDPPYMFSSYVDYSGETAPKGTGALTQMTLEALEIVKRDKGGKSGWISEGVRSAETDAKYERLIAAGVPFQRTDTGTYFLMPQDLQALDLNKVADTLNKKYGNRK